jgi:hypothetical protein
MIMVIFTLGVFGLFHEEEGAKRKASSKAYACWGYLFFCFYSSDSCF